MKTKLLLIILIYASSVFSQTQQAELNNYFTALTRINNFNGNILVAKNDEVVFRKNYNLSHLPVSLQTNIESKFIVASVSKVFIKYSIIKLAEQNQLSLKDNLDKFIPNFPNGKIITIEQLLTHQSGLPRELTDYEKHESLSLKKIAELAMLEKLQFEPATQILYSNVGYHLLHFIIDKVAPHGYLHYINTEIIEKYKLLNTGEFNAQNAVTNFAYGFDLEKDTVKPIAKISITRFETGNYYSTVDDLFLFSKGITSGENIAQAFTLKMFGTDSTLIQAGGRPGYRAYLYKNLKSGITFIYTCNTSNVPVQNINTDVMNLLENKPYKIPQKINRKHITIDAAVLKRYEGQYALQADVTQTFTFIAEGNKLFGVDKDNQKTEIFPETETTFFEDSQSADSYKFFFNNTEKCWELILYYSGVEWKAIKQIKDKK